MATSTTMSEVCRALGIVPTGGNHATVWKWIDLLSIDAEHLRIVRATDPIAPLLPYLLHPRRVAEAVAASESIAEVCRYLGLDDVRHRKHVARAVRSLGLDVAHFTGQAWRKGSVVPPVRAKPLAEVLCSGRLAQSSEIRKRLIAEGPKEQRCEWCGSETWIGQTIPLELDHINGDRADNRIENLRLLCPNCHALTSTYRGRNIGRRGASGGRTGLKPRVPQGNGGSTPSAGTT